MNTLHFSLHSQAAKFCHQAAMLLLPQTCSLTTNYHPALHSSPSCPAPIPHFPAVVSTPCPSQHHTYPIPRIPSRTSGRATAYAQHWAFAGLCPFSSLATANGPASTRPSLACIFLPARLPLLLTCISRLWPKRARVPACGSPVGRGLSGGRSRARDALIRCGFAGRARRGVWAVLAGT